MVGFLSVVDVMYPVSCGCHVPCQLWVLCTLSVVDATNPVKLQILCAMRVVDVMQYTLPVVGVM